MKVKKHLPPVYVQINITYTCQLSTAYLFGIYSLRLTRERIKNCLNLFIQVICGNQVTTNCILIQNVVQTGQFVSTMEYNQPTQNNDLGVLKIEKPKF